MHDTAEAGKDAGDPREYSQLGAGKAPQVGGALHRGGTRGSLGRSSETPTHLFQHSPLVKSSIREQRVGEEGAVASSSSHINLNHHQTAIRMQGNGLHYSPESFYVSFYLFHNLILRVGGVDGRNEGRERCEGTELL